MPTKRWLDNMKTSNNTSIPFYYFLPGILWFGIILLLICLPQSKVPVVDFWWMELLRPDKIIHAMMFGVQSLLFILPFKKAKPNAIATKKRIIGISILVMLWGLATECIQLNVPGRSFEWLDWLADSVGVFIIMIYFLRQQKNVSHHL
jgi:hypothetical protein